MSPQYAALCGITEKELQTVFAEDITLMAEENGCTPEEMHHKLKEQFDGYHFTRNSEDIYNPFSLLNAFDEKAIDSYWFATGTPTYLIRQLQRFRTDITTLDDIQAPASAFDRPTEAMTDALPLLYQSGYLTIKGYDAQWDTYHLALPNKEVRVGLMAVIHQIDEKNYLLPYTADGRKLVKCGISFNTTTRNIEEWELG